ncbi:hypothetical protein LTR53_006481 [Teratosphaeriaceae sp. CCFEE 6253]|nr:hypothetical protein LTR53_006481 [Teratosphaeriaceae sp. CCFEE 6253]
MSASFAVSAGGMLVLHLRHRCPPTHFLRLSFSVAHRGLRHEARSRDPVIGLRTPVPDNTPTRVSPSPFYFEAGYAGWAKRPSRPFPPPFFSPPSGSFIDPLSTHNKSTNRRQPKVHGELIRGITVGDDAVLVSENLIGANDGVGAWAQRERGHAPLWSRLILHFVALAAEGDGYGAEGGPPDLAGYMAQAYERTKEALSEPNNWDGTTTSSLALLHYVAGEDGREARPVVYVAQLGDSKVMIVRQRERQILFETEEQWHYFDCPRQLGTNSPDTPRGNAVLSRVEVEEADIVLALSDGVTDNLWGEEIAETAVASLEGWQEEAGSEGERVLAEGMRFVAQEIVLAARKIAEDPFAGSPFMERAVEEGLAIEGGKLDDISVVAALCKKRKG